MFSRKHFASHPFNSHDTICLGQVIDKWPFKCMSKPIHSHPLLRFLHWICNLFNTLETRGIGEGYADKGLDVIGQVSWLDLVNIVKVSKHSLQNT